MRRARTSVPLSVALCTLMALLYASCSGTDPVQEAHDDTRAAHWGYGAEDGPAQWASMSSEWSLCGAGLEQSPIDLVNPSPIELPPVEIDLPGDQEVEVMNQEGVIDALDNGHTIQINTKGAEKMTVGETTYRLAQFHFHAPSEHTFDGRHFPIEMHFVHQAEGGELAVMGVLVEEGAENPSLAPLWSQLAQAPGTEATVRIPPGFAEHLFSGETTGVYHYRGSLTTPPCSEGVRWYIRKTPTQLSREQIAAFTARYNHNNRPVQALGDRTLYLDENPKLTID